jgi:hypothetical protein
MATPLIPQIKNLKRSEGAILPIFRLNNKVNSMIAPAILITIKPKGLKNNGITSFATL